MSVLMAIGVIVALVSAFFSPLRESLRKYISDDFSSVEIGLLGQVYGTIILFPFAAAIYLQSGIVLTPELVLAGLISGGVVVSSTFIYVEAMRISDFSLTEPLRQTTPIFVAVLEPLILGTNYSIIVFSAALLGAIGAYILVSKDSVAEPIKNMNNIGALLSILVAFLFAIWAIVSRFGATNTHPLLFTYITYLVALIGFGLWQYSRDSEISYESYLRKDVFAMGTVTAASAVIGIYAYSFISASEVTIIKQTSGIFGVLIGGQMFKEDDIVRKLVGAGIIVSAVVLVVL